MKIERRNRYNDGIDGSGGGGSVGDDGFSWGGCGSRWWCGDDWIKSVS